MHQVSHVSKVVNRCISLYAYVATANDGSGKFGTAEITISLQVLENKTYSEPGIYGPSSGVETINNAIVSASGVTLQNLNITGDLELGEGIGEGDVTLKNVTVHGTTVVRGGGVNSIHVLDSVLFTVIVNRQTGVVRILAEGATRIEEVQLESPATLEESGLTVGSNGFNNVTVTEDVQCVGDERVIMIGGFGTLSSRAPQAIIELPAGTVLHWLILNALAEISGTGSIDMATINASGSTLTTRPGNMTLGDGLNVSIGGETVTDSYSSEDSATIQEVAIDMNSAKVTMDCFVAGLIAADFEVTATLDGEPYTLTNLRYNANQKRFTFDPVSLVGNLNKVLKVTISPASSTTKLTGEPHSDEITVQNGFSGRITDVQSVGVSGATLSFRAGADPNTGDIIATAVADSDGYYSVFVGPGDYVGTVTTNGFVTTFMYVNSLEGYFGIDRSTTAIRTTGMNSVRIVLTWGLAPTDEDSHLTGPTADGDGQFHTWYADKVYQNDGIRYADLDWDDTTSYGPETTTIYKLVDGKYKFYVHNYSHNGALVDSGAKVEVYHGSDTTPVNTFNIPTMGSVDALYWTVFNMTVVDGEISSITAVNDLTVESPLTEAEATAVAAINAGSATAQNYTDAGITGVTTGNLANVNTAVAAAKADKESDLTRSEIQAVVDKGAAIAAANDALTAYLLAGGLNTDAVYVAVQDALAADPQVTADIEDATALLVTATTALESDFTYTETADEAQVTGYTGTGGNVIIPDTLGGFPVTSIGDNAFYDCTGLTTISLPQGVTSIGVQAFFSCTGLTTISIPQGVTSIGAWAFSECRGLTSITVAVDNLNYASRDGVLYNEAGTILVACPGGLTTISIPQGVTSIGDGAFMGCAGLTTISIPQGVTSIGDNAFFDCAGLTTISLPQGVTSIGDFAFYYCTGLTTISLPQEVTSIGMQAFTYCDSLTSITFNSATTAIYDYADTIPAAIKIIGYDPSTAKDYATKYGNTFEVIGTTNSLQSITITTPATKLTYTVGDSLDISGLVVTGTNSDNSTQVETITAANITGFDSSAPNASQTLTVTVGGKTATYTISIAAATQDTDFTYTETADEAQVTGYTGTGGNVTIPDTLGGYPVTSIGHSAFYGCTSLTGINIPQGVTSIGTQAFSYCDNLSSISVSSDNSDFESIEGSLYNKTGTTLIGIPGGATTINIPQGVSNIAYSYIFSECMNLASITVADGNQYYASIDGVLYNKTATALLACPTVATTVSIPSTVTNIGSDAFTHCLYLTSINLPLGLNSIENYAFSNSGITSINIPQNVTFIGHGVFDSCFGLTSITVAVDNVNYASINGVLYNKAGTILIACPAGLTTISIPQGVTSIGAQAFLGCTGLTTISIPQGVTSIGTQAFLGCTGLTSIRFDSATTTIDDYADTIPAAIKIIGYDPSTAKDYATKYGNTFEVIH